MAWKIIVSGKVQGVGFRYSAKRKADTLGIKGWARNLQNGDVEIFAEGKKVKEFIEWCKKGPPFSRVENVRAEDLPGQPIRAEGFEAMH